MKTTPANDRKEALARRRASHHKALESLRGPNCTLNGLQIWRKLRRLETAANDACTAQCNGAAYKGQPFREEDAWDNFKLDTKFKVWAAFGKPDFWTVYFNSDPRGYTLKLDDAVARGMNRKWNTVPKCCACGCDALSCHEIHAHSAREQEVNASAVEEWRNRPQFDTDWGGYGILAPVIN